MAHDDVIRAAVSIIHRRDNGRILCVWNKRYDGWSLPGGKVEAGETPQQAQARELREETSLETIEAVQVFEGPHGLSVESTRGSVVHVFRVAAKGEPTECEMGCPVTWLTVEEFLRWSPMSSFYDRIRELLAEDDTKIESWASTG